MSQAEEKLYSSEYIGMAPVLGVMMSVIVMRISGEVGRKVRKGYRACQRFSGRFSLSFPADATASRWQRSGRLVTFLVKCPLLGIHATLRLVAKLPRYTVRSKSWAWPRRAPSTPGKHSTGKWSSRHWRYWRSWRWAYGRKAQPATTNRQDTKTYADFKAGQPSRFSLGYLWKVDVKWSLRKGHFHLLRQIMSRSTQIFRQGIKHCYRGTKFGKLPYGRMSWSSPSTWWTRSKGQLGSGEQIKQHKAKISKLDQDGSTCVGVSKYNTVLRQYNNRLYLYRCLPLKTMSRWWGAFNQRHLPVWLRTPAFNLYIWMFDCKLQEAAVEDLTQYSNLCAFFRRELKPGLRPVATEELVSPADGRVLYHGRVQDGALEQVKGVHYSLRGFLGPLSHSPVRGGGLFTRPADRLHMDQLLVTALEGSICCDILTSAGDAEPTLKSLADAEPYTCYITDENYARSLLHDPNKRLYHSIVYLAPGDYHRFHSPCDWTVQWRRHFPGELFSVKPGIARWLQGLFSFNERAAYFGEWEHGFFSMTAVGATNVGSINVWFDEELTTNTKQNYPPGTMFDKHLRNPDGSGVKVTKGQLFGDFNLGSTIVLVFEAPEGFCFSVEKGQKVQYGQEFGEIWHPVGQDIIN